MSYTALPTKNPGDLLTSALWNTYLQGNADSGFARMLADTTLVGAAASISFASIPTTFAHLLLLLTGRGDTAATTVGVSARFNADAGANYAAETEQANSTVAPATAESVSATSVSAALIAAATATASHVGSAAIFIPHYTGTTFFKQLLALTVTTIGITTGSMWVSARAGVWASAAAINQVQLILAAGNFIAGTRATLYGLPQ